jgi:hypothetical protein
VTTAAWACSRAADRASGVLAAGAVAGEDEVICEGPADEAGVG